MVKKRKRKRRYITGVHISNKCQLPIKYRSGWEKQVCLFLDFDTLVISYCYEDIQIPYQSNIKTGKVRIYYPDFLISYSDNSKLLVEVKPINKLKVAKNIKKFKAAEEWCKNQIGTKFETWTDLKIKEISKLNQMNYPNLEELKPKKKKRKKKRVSK